MVVVTHEMGFAREVANRVMFIDEGKIKEENSPHEFFDHPQNPRLKDFLSKGTIGQQLKRSELFMKNNLLC